MNIICHETAKKQNNKNKLNDKFGRKRESSYLLKQMNMSMGICWDDNKMKLNTYVTYRYVREISSLLDGMVK